MNMDIKLKKHISDNPNNINNNNINMGKYNIISNTNNNNQRYQR